VARELVPGCGVVALAADLPALRPEQLTAALREAARLGPAARGIVADARGTGTVLLAAGPEAELSPTFGGASRRAHVEGGASDLTDVLADAVPGLRRDVDTLDDLADAATLGVGPATRDLLERAPTAAAPVDLQATVRRWSPTTGGAAVTDDGRDLVLPPGLRLVGLRGLRPGQRVRLRCAVGSDGGAQVEAAGLVTERF
jgi:2-phospho-L-lactate guanylyltransferase